MTAPQHWYSAAVQAMGLVMYVSAARHDATPAQTQRLQEDVLPYLRSDQYRRRGDEQPALDLIHAIMGEDWVPTGDWARQLELLGRNERGERSR